MVWPSLISVAEAPGPYLAACAKALPAKATAMPTPSAVRREMRRRSLLMSRSSERTWWKSTRDRGAAPTRQARPHQADKPRHARRHAVHEGDQDNAIDRPGCRLRDLVGDVRNELDEQG